MKWIKMVKFIYTFLLILKCTLYMDAQYSWVMMGSVNGDQVIINASVNGSQVTGNMKDSQQNYDLSGKLTNNVFEGNATNASLGINFILYGQYSGDKLVLEAYLDNQGSKLKAFEATFYQAIPEAPMPSSEVFSSVGSNQSVPTEVKNKSIDPYIIGTWREESHYSSGYGDNAFSGSTYNYMSFNSDHTMSDNGSEAAMSGSNYSGNSGGQTTGKIIPNLWYYTSGGKIFVHIKTDGNPTIAEIGTYYIENGKMLFTQANTAKKILYTKM
jgi:hypothetical protein